jgi:hypothetical protein
MDKPTVREILDKLVQDPELKKYPHSYNPIIIERAEASINALFATEDENENLYD